MIDDSTTAGVTEQNGKSPSFVLYQTVLAAGEVDSWAKNSPPIPTSLIYPGKSPFEVAQFNRLIQGIGIAIGNTAAHELGHQFNLEYIDCDGAGRLPCPVTAPNKPFLWEYYTNGLPSFLYIGAPMNWLPSDIDALNKILVGVNGAQ
jgi:hypothetical protein